MYHLVVKHPFGSYAVGAIITDQQEAAAVMAAGHGRNVLRVNAPPAPEPDHAAVLAAEAAVEAAEQQLAAAQQSEAQA